MRRLEHAGWPARGRTLLALALLVGVGLTAGGCYIEAPYAAPPPGPPPPVVYVPGQWVWNGVGWVWRPPYWTAAPYAAPPPGSGQPAPQSPPPPAPKP